MHFARAMDATSEEEDAFGGGRLARIDVSNDADISRLRERRISMVYWQGCRARAHCVWTVLILLARFNSFPLLN
jgi:hypothetical protein